MHFRTAVISLRTQLSHKLYRRFLTMSRKRSVAGASKAGDDAPAAMASPAKKSRINKSDSSPSKAPKAERTSQAVGDSIPYSDLAAPAAQDTGRLLRIMTWNVAGIRGTLKKNPDILKTLVEKYSVDFMCLQETKISDEQLKTELEGDILPGYEPVWCCSSTKKGYAGTVVFVNGATFPFLQTPAAAAPKVSSKSKKLTDMWGKSTKSGTSGTSNPAVSPTNSSIKGRVLSTACDQIIESSTKHAGEGRTITLELESFYLVACYVPNSGQNLERLDYRVNEWEPDMRAYLKRLLQSKPVVYCGDMNVAHLDADIYNFDAKHIVKQSGCTPQERAAFGELLGGGFVDAFRHFHADATGHFTYWSQRTFARNFNKGLRLDYFVCSDNLVNGTPSGSGLPRIVDCVDIPGDTIGLSDHAPVMLTMTI